MIPAERTPLQIDYAPRSRGRSFRLPAFSIIAFLAVAIPIVALYCFLYAFVPRLETTYHDFGTRLPGMTQIFMDIARAGEQQGFLPATSFPIAAGFLAPLLTRSNPKTAHRSLIILFLVMNAVLFAIFIITLVILVDPLFTLLRQINP